MSAQHPVGPQVRIRPYRVVVGLTLEALADRIAEHGVTVSVPHLSAVETGRQPASERLLRAWALALGLNPLDVWRPQRVGTGGTAVDDEGTGETEVTQAA